LSKPITKSHVNPQEYNKLFNLIKVHWLTLCRMVRPAKNDTVTLQMEKI
jgi:hypothetical protein